MFNYFKFSENNQGKPQFIDASLPMPEHAYHASVYSFSEIEITDKTRRSGDFWLDIDDKQNILQAVTDTRATLSHLAGLGLDLSVVSIYASGSKGFHIRVPANCFSADSRYDLPLAYKKIAESIIAYTGATSIDLNLYKMGLGQSLRIANKQRANGFYKVPISLQELDGIESEADYFALCSNPRPEIEVTPPAFVKELGRIFNSALKSVADDSKFEAVTMTAAELEVLQGAIPNCVQQLANHENINPDDDKSGFNSAKQSLARYLRNSGLDDAKQDVIIKQFAENYPSSKYPTPELRDKELRSILKLKGDFSCGFMKAVLDKNPCSGCPILSKCQEKTTRQNLINKVSTNKKHIAAIIKAMQTATGETKASLGLTLCKCIAKSTPSKQSVDDGVAFVVGHGVNEVIAREIIQGAVDAETAAIRSANQITNFEGLTRVNVDNMTHDAIAELMLKKYLTALETKKPIVFNFNLSMAAGKTTIATIFINKVREWFKPMNFHDKIPRQTVIAHRVSLIKGLSNRFHIANYQQIENKYDFRGSFATCADSLPQFQHRNPILIVDEARQTLEHMATAETIGSGDKTKGGRSALYDKFKKCYESADLTILLDADLDDLTLEWFKENGQAKEFVLFEMTNKQHPANHTILTGGHDAARNKIVELVNSGRRGVVACTSEKQCLMTAKHLKKEGVKRILTITGENKGNDRQAAFLTNTQFEWDNYDVVVHSPVIGSGVSLENPYLDFTVMLNTCVVPSNEAWQMVGRNRCAKDIFISFDRASNLDRVTDFEVFIEAEKERIAEITLSELQDRGMGHENFASVEEFVKGVTVSELTKLQARITAKRNADLNDYENSMIVLGQLQGRTFSYDSKEHVIKGLRKEVIADIVESRLNAKPIDAETVESYKLEPNKTQEMSDELNRFEVCKMAGTDDITEVDVLNHLGGMMSKVAKFEMLQKPENELKADDAMNRKTLNKTGSKVKEAKIAKEILAKLDGKEFSRIEAVEICKILARNHKEFSHCANYKKTTDYPVKRVSDFVKRYGYETVKIGTKGDQKRSVFYSIKINDDVSKYVSNRAALKGIEPVKIE